ncbi:MAG: glycine--tRNA ligase subunit beta [Rhodospirillaceae bacterium]|nr:glycine--tRNA ligase subunit beta [Rhodospirillaceae bacterium]
MAEFLLEILCEEIPASLQQQKAVELGSLIHDQLNNLKISYDQKAQVFSSPRRLIIVMDQMAEKIEAQIEEKKGPRVGSDDKAIQGFLKGAGLKSLDQCEQQETPKGTFWIAKIRKEGGSVAEMLPNVIEQAMKQVNWPKSMRFGEHQFPWIRPLRQVLVVFNGKLLSGNLNLSGQKFVFTNKTVGHRFMAPKEITVQSFADYQDKLRKAYVIIDQNERKEKIKKQIKEACKAGHQLRQDSALLDEVVGLVEWPKVLLGNIDSDFMSLPSEVLATSMRVHQKFFSVIDLDGKSVPHFLTVANIEAPDKGEAIIKGNQRVLRARLSDARFFYELDCKISLADYAKQTQAILFYQGLGNVWQKTERLQSLVKKIGAYIPTFNEALAVKAAALCKADLVSKMVREFPELQGVMGSYYAAVHGEKPEVSQAIRDHYAPLGPNDQCPRQPITIALSLADKLDSLVGFWGINQKPTGSKDPFALRRQALGVIRLILENQLRLPLRDIIHFAYWGYGEVGVWQDKSPATDKAHQPKFIANQLLEFFVDRLKVTLKDQGIRHDLITAVFANQQEDDLWLLVHKIKALQEFIAKADGNNLLIAAKRAGNILAIEEKKDNIVYQPLTALPKVLPAEQQLFDQLAKIKPVFMKHLQAEKFNDALTLLSQLRQPLDQFFEEVVVNSLKAEERLQRLQLLSSVRELVVKIADLSKVEGI